MSSTTSRKLKPSKTKRKKTKSSRSSSSSTRSNSLTFQGRHAQEPAITSDQMALPTRRKYKHKKDKKSKEREMLLGKKPRELPETISSHSSSFDKNYAEAEDEDNYDDDAFEDYEDDFDAEEPETTESTHGMVPEKGGEMKSSSPESEGKLSETGEHRLSKQHKDEQKESLGREKGFNTPESPTESKGEDLKKSRKSIKEEKPVESPHWDDETAASKLGYSDTATYTRAKMFHSRRVRELSKLVELEEECIDLLELHSLQPWDFYIQSVGALGQRKQGFSQTGEHDREIGTQTEPVEKADSSSNIPQCASRGEEDGESWSGIERVVLQMEGFLNEEGVAMVQRSNTVALGLDETKSDLGVTPATTSDTFISQNFVIGDENEALGILKGHKLHLLRFSCSDMAKVLAIYHPGSGKHYSRITVWDTEKMNRQIYACDCPLHVTSAILHFNTLVIGTIEGSVSLLSTQDIPRVETKNTVLPICAPKWSTDAISQGAVAGHMDQVCDIRTVGGSSHSSTGIATMDISGVVHLWTLVQEASHLNSLEPRAKLVHVTSVGGTSKVLERPRTSWTAITLSCPGDGTQVFVGTSGGSVVRYNRYGSSELPGKYEPKSSTLTVLEAVRSVSSVDFHPCIPHLFLVGFGDGSLMLFSLHQALPQRTWTWDEESVGILKVAWSLSRPAVFYLLHSNGDVTVWDLLSNLEGEVSCELIEEVQGQSSVNWSMDISGNLTETKLVLSSGVPNSVLRVCVVGQAFNSKSIVDIEAEKIRLMEVLHLGTTA